MSWHSYGTPSAPGGRDAGGHYAAHEHPETLVGDIRQFFAGLTR